MPSFMPLLSYSTPIVNYSTSSQGDLTAESPSAAGKASTESSEKGSPSVRNVVDKEVRSGSRVVDAVSKAETASKKGGKKVVKKKRRPGGDQAAKVASVRESSTRGDDATKRLDEEKVEDLVMKAKSHAQAVHAVKRAVFEIQLFFLDGIRNAAQLQTSSALLTQSEYQDVVVERSIDKQCGYPLCDRPLMAEAKRKGRFRVSLSEHKIYDIRETGLYCSQSCLMASKTFALSLQVERDGLIHPDKLATIVRSVRDLKGSIMRQNEELSRDQQMDRPKESVLSDVKERQDTGVASFEDAGPSDSIEGYTPVTSIRDWRLRRNEQQQSTLSAEAKLNESKLEAPASGNSNVSTSDGTLLPPKASLPSNTIPLDKGKLALVDELGKLTMSQQGSPVLKSILKKGKSGASVKRSVSWGDQKTNGGQRSKAEPKVKQKTGSKPRRQVKEMPQPPRRTSALHNSSVVDRDISASSSVRDRVTADIQRELAEAKAAEARISERLSSAEQPIRMTDQLQVAEVKSNLTSPSTHADSQVEKLLSAEQRMGSTTSLSSSNGQIGKGGGRNDSMNSATDDEAQIAERLSSAEALAAALTQASEAIAAGDFESSEAVSRAGISILSVRGTDELCIPADLQNEAANQLIETSVSNSASSANVGLKWPHVEAQEEEDEEVCSSKDGWHDTAPKDFKVEISSFGTIWMALEEWISAATIAFVYGKEAHDEEECLCVNGREYKLQVVCDDGVSAEISKAFSNCIARVLPDVVQALRLNVSIFTLEQALGRMVRTMSFVEPLPAFGGNHWRMLVMLFLEGLSVDQVDSIQAYLSNHSSLFRKLLVSTGTSEAEYDTFRGLLLPSGRMPSFSTLSGG